MKKDELRSCLKAMSAEDREALLKGLDADDGDDGDGDEEGLGKSISSADLERALGAIEGQLALPDDARPAASLTDPAERIGGARDVSLAKSMDATGFVQGLVDGVVAHIAELNAAVVDISETQAIGNTSVLASGHAVLNLQKSFDGLVARIESLEKSLGQPAPRRSATPGVAPQQRAFGQQPAQPGAGQLTKSQVKGRLRKAFDAAKDGNDRNALHAAQAALIHFETTGGGLNNAAVNILSRGNAA